MDDPKVINDVRDIKHHFSSGVYSKQMSLPKGFQMRSHSHKFDHMSILAQGVGLVTVNGVSTEYHAPCVLEIKAGQHHDLYAIEDISWFCIHATEETDIDKIDEVLSE